MKKLILLFTLPVFLFGFIKFKLNRRENLAFIKARKNNSFGCGPYSGGNMEAGEDGKFITVLPGWGNYGYSISTKNDSAQFYFNQGLNMYYSYHWLEANASFKEAARFDPGSAMTYWGEALAMGPGYNFSLHYKMRKEVPQVMQLMNQHINQATAKEKKLIEVMNLRYTSDTADLQRASLNRAYAHGMRELVSLYPTDPDIKILYVDAVMLIHAWDLWNNDGTPKQWTPEVIRFCEEVLKENPHHPAALHYYIHLTEASRHPELALASADTLKDLMPGVAHMVHMSSHEYERNGSYAMGVEVNDRADDDMINYESLVKNIHLKKYASHYYAVQAFCGLTGAMYTKGLSDAIRCRKSVTPVFDDTYLQYLYMMPAFANVRMGKWNELLKDNAEPDASWTYAGLIYDFARGIAFVNTGHPDSARGRLILLQSKLKDSMLSIADTLTNKALQGAVIAGEILSSSIFFSEKKYDSAIAHINLAIQVEDGMFYYEPKDWLIPARQFLGAYYLKMSKPDLAEKIYREDLIWNPGNGWSLLGLCQSLKAQNKIGQIAGYQKKYLNSFSHADQIPPGSVYMK
jgi:tetratricopeptide (TPR) repeat protein